MVWKLRVPIPARSAAFAAFTGSIDPTGESCCAPPRTASGVAQQYPHLSGQAALAGIRISYPQIVQ